MTTQRQHVTMHPSPSRRFNQQEYPMRQEDEQKSRQRQSIDNLLYHRQWKIDDVPSMQDDFPSMGNRFTIVCLLSPNQFTIEMSAAPVTSAPAPRSLVNHGSPRISATLGIPSFGGTRRRRVDDDGSTPRQATPRP
eukprot:CCRYP_001509-RA/>CCRYP_001509-RA protein AED:0.27 eAED:0.27 QI:172/1/0.5/1/1/1/2/262/135